MKRFFTFFLLLSAIVSVCCAEMGIVTQEQPYTISGSGTQILDGVDITFPARIIINGDNSIKVTLYEAGYEDTPITLKPGCSDKSYTGIVRNLLTVSSIMVETQGSWKLDFLPFGAEYSPNASRKGSFVSDFFQVEPPVIVNITVDNKDEWGSNCVISLCKVDSNGNDTEEIILDEYISDRVSFDAIIKPEKDVFAYYWFVSCSPDVQWSITAK